MKTVIIYASTHHGNTKKVVDQMAACIDADIVDITKSNPLHIAGYDLIGFASGIYFGSFHEKITKFVEKEAFSKRQKAFLVDTCGIGYKNYSNGIRKKLERKGVTVLGNFQCRGYDTYGIWGKLGGVAKGHPNETDFNKAQSFIKQLVKKAENEETETIRH
ncbi:flavodoxin family protein [Hominifimenecus sp. rT4P-3]|uniref:flavodoxin family protein n=1 Tax=Hominifimenecus sp. rT4P-3 TaxID=3242979 RepID=UPI003DA3C553